MQFGIDPSNYSGTCGNPDCICVLLEESDPVIQSDADNREEN